MSAAKRPASNSFGSSQMVVKRQKSDANLNGKDLAVTAGGKKGANGTLIQSVSLPNPSAAHNHLPHKPLAEPISTRKTPD